MTILEIILTIALIFYGGLMVCAVGRLSDWVKEHADFSNRLDNIRRYQIEELQAREQSLMARIDAMQNPFLVHKANEQEQPHGGGDPKQ